MLRRRDDRADRVRTPGRRQLAQMFAGTTNLKQSQEVFHAFPSSSGRNDTPGLSQTKVLPFRRGDHGAPHATGLRTRPRPGSVLGSSSCPRLPLPKMAAPDFAIRSEDDDTWLLFAQSDAAREWAREHLRTQIERRGSAIVVANQDVHKLVPRMRRAELRVEVVAPALRRFFVKIGTLRSGARFA